MFPLSRYDNVINLADRLPADMRYVRPLEILIPSSGCLVHSVLTVGHVLIDAHEREVLKAGAKFIEFGNYSADIMVGSRTTCGDLMTYTRDDTRQIVHDWSFDN